MRRFRLTLFVYLELDHALVTRFREQSDHAITGGAHGFRRRRRALFCGV